jgi:hypothetical protein
MQVSRRIEHGSGFKFRRSPRMRGDLRSRFGHPGPSAARFFCGWPFMLSPRARRSCPAPMIGSFTPRRSFGMRPRRNRRGRTYAAPRRLRNPVCAASWRHAIPAKALAAEGETTRAEHHGPSRAELGANHMVRSSVVGTTGKEHSLVRVHTLAREADPFPGSGEFARRDFTRRHIWLAAPGDKMSGPSAARSTIHERAGFDDPRSYHRAPG